MVIGRLLLIFIWYVYGVNESGVLGFNVCIQILELAKTLFEALLITVVDAYQHHVKKSTL